MWKKETENKGKVKKKRNCKCKWIKNRRGKEKENRTGKLIGRQREKFKERKEKCMKANSQLGLGNNMRFSGGDVRLCLPLPLSPHPYMVLPVSQSLLVQSVSALSWLCPRCLQLCLPIIVCSTQCYLWIIVNVSVSMFLPVFLCLLRLSSIKYPVCFYPRLLVPGSPCTVTE